MLQRIERPLTDDERAELAKDLKVELPDPAVPLRRAWIWFGATFAGAAVLVGMGAAFSGVESWPARVGALAAIVGFIACIITFMCAIDAIRNHLDAVALREHFREQRGPRSARR